MKAKHRKRPKATRGRKSARGRAGDKTRKTAKLTKERAQQYNQKLESALKDVRNGTSLAAAARKINVRPGRLRKYIESTGVAERRNGKLIFKRDRRFRRMPIYSSGRRVVITVRGLKTARLIGEYMSAVRQFFETEDIDFLAPFRGQSIIDVSRKRYIFETRPNVLFRLDASGVEPFELVYAIVKPE